MSSTSASFLPTSVSEFIDFLNGKMVPVYVDSKETLIDVLSSLIHIGLRHQYAEFLRMKSLQQREESEFIGDTDVIDFLIRVFPTPYVIIHPGPIRDALISISQISVDVLIGWLTRYRESELDTLKNPSSQVPLFGIFSQSSVRTHLYFLLEYTSAFDSTIDDENVLQSCNEIQDAILKDLMEYLERISISEANAQFQKQGDLKHSPSGRGIVFGGQNQQDGTSQDIEHSEWFLAWEDEFRGSALENLEVKLTLNVQALQTSQKDKIEMSRIIPIVQSSGTGKSRLAEQYVKENFGVFLGLKNGHGYPPPDEYVYKYFKNLLRLEKHRDWDTPDDPNDLSDFDKYDLDEYRQRSNDGGYMVDEKRSVYIPKWRYERPKGESVPQGWAAVGRLRAACFIAGFFRTMVSYMETEDYSIVQGWRNNLLHTDISNPGSARNQFWYDVIKASLSILKASNLQTKWWNDHENRTNAHIKWILMKILESAITVFFEHPVTKACLSEMRKADLPFVLIIDEATYLYQTNYMHSFMWVLDEPVVGVLKRLGYHCPQAKKFFVLMLGTHSQISHFAPDYIYPSERVFSRKQSLPSVFLSLDWDSGVDLPERSIRFNESACVENLVKWGRPMWLSFYNGLNRAKTIEKTQSNAYILKKAVLYAVEKLREPDRRSQSSLSSDESSLTTFAILAIRLHLDLDFAAPSRASKLVTSRLRWLIDVDCNRKYLVTTYGSEPIIAEAAAYLLNSPKDPTTRNITHPWISPLKELGEQLLHGYVNKGAHGELTARLLLIMAKDQVTRESWWKDETFLSLVSELAATEIKQDSFSHVGYTFSDHYFKEVEYYYRSPPDGFAFFHRAVKVKDFLKGFLSDMVFSQLASHFKRTKKWKSLNNAYVNFTHWAPVMGHDSDYAFTKEGLFANWIRHKAYFLGKCNFKAIDLVIPMAFLINGIIDLDSLSYIVISVQNKTSGTELKRQTYLSTNEVEGVPSEQGTMKPACRSSNLKLTLHSLGFINPSTNIISDENLVDHWVKPSADKPYIAFAMSMGDTSLDDTSQLFIPEKSTQRSKHRIVFGLQGFLNTYHFPNKHIQEILENILIRHDVSGRYPTSAPDYRPEEVILRAARKPLDEPEDILRRWFPSTPIESPDVEMSSGQESEEEDEEEDGELDSSSEVHAMDIAQ